MSYKKTYFYSFKVDMTGVFVYHRATERVVVIEDL